MWVREYHRAFWYNTRTYIEEANANCREIVKDGSVYIPRKDKNQYLYRAEPRPVNLTQIARDYISRHGYHREMIRSLMMQDPRCEGLTDKQVRSAISDVFRKEQVRG